MREGSSAVVATTAETQTPQGLSERANNRLRSARRSRRSPSGSGRVLSRQEADGCNQILEAMYANGRHGRRWAGMTDTYIGSLERGDVRWPNHDYRAALRAFFNATDIELGFYVNRAERLPDAGTTAILAENNDVRTTPAAACAHCGARRNTPVGVAAS
jgi:hypothetical protein